MRTFRLTIIVGALFAIGIVQAYRHQGEINDQKRFTSEVLEQYIRYYCPNAGVCRESQALERMNREWPHVYRLGFQVLEHEE